MRLRSIAVVAALLLVAAACGDSDEGGGTTTQPEAEPAAAAPGGHQVAFDGSRCSVSGPSVVAPGAATFVVTNNADEETIPLYVVALTEGHGFADLAALQSEVGGPPAFVPMPEWAVYALRRFDLAGSGLAANQDHYAFNLELGNHAVYLWRENPSAIWLCGPLEVVAT